MNYNERAENMSKLTDYFKPGNNKNVRKMLTVLLRISQLSRLLLCKIRKPSQQKKMNHFTLQVTFSFLKENLEKDNILARPAGSNNLNGCIMMSSKWISFLFTSKQQVACPYGAIQMSSSSEIFKNMKSFRDDQHTWLVGSLVIQG